MATSELVAARQEIAPVEITFQFRDEWRKIFAEGSTGWLNRYLVERDHVNFIMGLAAISGTDMMLLGSPGAGKTYGIELMSDECIADSEIFTHLLAKDQSADEILGPKDISALKESRLRRMTAGYLPEANFGYLDEFFKASPPTLNPLLDVMATRKLKVGGEVKKLSKLISIFMSSNELPTGREDLAAMRDRIDVCMVVENVKTPVGWKRVMEIQRELRRTGLDKTGMVPLTIDQFIVIRAEVMQIDFPDSLIDKMVEMLGKFHAADHLPSMRRLERMQRMCCAHAWVHGRDVCAQDDLVPVQHMAWSDMDHAKSARDIVSEYLGKFTRLAREVKDKLDTIMPQINDLKNKISTAQSAAEIREMMMSGTGFLTQLKGVKEEAERLMKEGKAERQDIQPVEEVLDEINRAYAWANEALTQAMQGGFTT